MYEGRKAVIISTWGRWFPEKLRERVNPCSVRWTSKEPFPARALASALALSLVVAGCGGEPDHVVDAARVQQKSDTITRWNSNSITVLSPTNPLDLTRGLAMVHLAMHDAVNAVRPRYEGYAYRTSGETEADPDLAAAAAARDVLVALRPGSQAHVDELFGTDQNAVPSDDRRSRSLGVGKAAADAILSLRANDGSQAKDSYTPGTAPGDYQYTTPNVVLAPHWRYVTPFALQSPSQFRAPGPPPLGSDQYARDYDEVKAFGAVDSTVRKDWQTQEARFWVTVPAIISNRVARDLAAAQRLDLWEAARAFALIQMAFADGLIATWDSKFEYDFWRPITAIRLGDLDGNDATAPDPQWTPLNTTPPFPEYPSAHAVVTAASGVILKDTFGANTSFTATSDFLSGVTRTYASFDELTLMSTLSRIWGGFHFRTACFDGKAQGEAVGHWVLDRYLRPLPDA
jgi:hypothetical protein